MNPRLLPWVVPLAMTFCSANATEPFFQDCAVALASPRFKELHDFYAGHPEEPRPAACFRLDDREFLVTVTAAGRRAQGLYYFNAGTGQYEFPDGAYREAIAVKEEFEGAGNKRFVLLERKDVHEGSWSTGFEILFLKPGQNGRSFEIQKLLSAHQDPVSGMCGSKMQEGLATEVKDLRVEREGTVQMALVFVLDGQVCPAGAIQSYERRFVWSSGRFIEKRSRARQTATSAPAVSD